MQIEVLKQEKDRSFFILKGINSVIANTIRRSAINEVPTLAVEKVTFKKNSSALYDEMLANRIGLIPIKTDAKDDFNPEKPVEITLKLKAEGPSIAVSSQMESSDPKCIPAVPEMPIVKLLKDQELEFEATATLGQGKDHSKFCPGLVYFKSVPTLKVSKDSKAKSVAEAFPDVLALKGQGLEIKDLVAWNEAIESACEKNDITIENSDTDFMFCVESWGQLTPKEIMLKSVEMIDLKLDELEKALKKVK